jgi:EmrB/QacA subfamily drug resistance transporter
MERAMSEDVELAPVTGSARRHVRLLFSLLALIEFMTVLDASIVNITLPSIQHSLGFSQAALTWVVTAYVLGYAGFVLPAGRAADLYGRRRLFVCGVALFTAASLACGMSPTAWFLIVARFAEGLGAALAAPAALALITDIFAEGSDRNQALGIFTGMATIAAPIGLILGGLLATVSWQYVFLINVPIGAAVLVVAPRLLPAGRPPDSGRVDLAGAVAGVTGLCLLVSAVVGADSRGWSSPVTLAGLGGALALLAAFVWRQRTAANPMIPTFLLRSRTIVVGNVVIALVGTLLLATFFIITLYLQRVRGAGPLAAAITYVPIPLAMLAGTQLAPRVVQRVGPGLALRGALLFQAIGLALWAAMISPNGGFVVTFLLPAMVWSFGLGASIVGSYIACTSGLTERVAGAASGLANTTFQAGGALGLAILGSVASARASALLRHSAVTAATDPQILVSGYALALWCAAGVAVVGALLTLTLRFDMAAARRPAA